MTPETDCFHLSSTYAVLEENGGIIPVALSDHFYEKLEDQFGDFKGKRLVSHYTFERDWNSWEMHPAGEELICLLSGRVDFVLEQKNLEKTVSLNTPGACFLVPRGIWHTAKVHMSSSVLFVTPGEGTQHRPL